MFRTSDIQARIRRRPFRPFRIVTSSGEHAEVTHPELILLLDTRVVVASPSRRDPSVGDRYVEIARMHVTALDDLPSEEAPRRK